MNIVDINTYRGKKQGATIDSAFYLGRVFHERLKPKSHTFKYPIYMMFINLDEVETLHARYWWFSNQRWAPIQFKASDYFQSTANNGSHQKINNNIELKNAAISIAQSLGADIEEVNKVKMLTQLRCFGFYFSPVNFFFLYKRDNARYLLAEVSNTPWNKKHCYLIDIDNPEPIKKEFHVSPFMNLNMNYQWSIRPPEKNVLVSIENWNKEKLFSARFSAIRHEINNQTISKILFKWPIMTAIIVKNIYWQAIKIFAKGIPYIPYQKPFINQKNSQKN